MGKELKNIMVKGRSNDDIWDKTTVLLNQFLSV